MYYKEKIIDGILMFKTSPNGDWAVAISYSANVVNRLCKLTDERRLEIFNLFCTHCGSIDPTCQCWSDE